MEARNDLLGPINWDYVCLLILAVAAFSSFLGGVYILYKTWAEGGK